MFRHLKNPSGVLADLIESSNNRPEPEKEPAVQEHPPVFEPESFAGSSSLAEWNPDKDCTLDWRLVTK